MYLSASGQVSCPICGRETNWSLQWTPRSSTSIGRTIVSDWAVVRKIKNEKEWVVELELRVECGGCGAPIKATGQARLSS